MKPLREFAESMDRLLGLAERHWLVPADIENVRELMKRAEAAESELARVRAELAAVCDEIPVKGGETFATAVPRIVRERDEARDKLSALEAQLSPDNDATDAAHPCWWRGHDAGAKGMAVLVEKLRGQLAECERERDELATLRQAAIVRQGEAVSELADVSAERHYLRDEVERMRAVVEAVQAYRVACDDLGTPSAQWRGARDALWSALDALTSAGSSSPQDSVPAPEPGTVTIPLLPTSPETDRELGQQLAQAREGRRQTRIGEPETAFTATDALAAVSKALKPGARILGVVSPCPRQGGFAEPPWVPKPETATFPALPIDAADEAIVDAMMAKRQGEARPIARREPEMAWPKAGDRVVINNSRPRFAGRKGEVIFAEGKSARVRLDGNVDPGDDVWLALENIGREPETTEVGASGSSQFYVGVCIGGPFADVPLWPIVDMSRPETIAYATSEAAAKHLAARCNAQRAEPVAQGVSRERVEAFRDEARKERDDWKRRTELVGPAHTEVASCRARDRVWGYVHGRLEELLAASPEDEQGGGR
jgi:hypothetical protein